MLHQCEGGSRLPDAAVTSVCRGFDFILTMLFLNFLTTASGSQSLSVLKCEFDCSDPVVSEVAVGSTGKAPVV